MTSYDIAKAILTHVAFPMFRVRVTGAQHVPLHGPLIIAANHQSYFDPLMLGAASPRTIAYMAKAELFRIPVLGPMITSFGAYPVDRAGSAKAAIKQSLDVIARGGCIGIFPEGTRNKTGEVQARTGVALLSALSKAPVVPAALVGTDRAHRLAQIKVAFGPAMALPADRKASREDLENFTDEIMRAIRALAESVRGNS